MKIERIIDLPLDRAVICDRVLSFFTRSGYRHTGGGEHLIFKRGSAAGSMCSFNPKQWQCMAEVEIRPDSGVAIHYDIRNDPFENSITRQIWTEEADSLEVYLAEGDAVTIDFKGNTRRVMTYVFGLIGLPAGIFLAAILGTAGGMYTFGFTGVSPAIAGGIGLGIFGVLTAIVVALHIRINH